MQQYSTLIIIALMVVVFYFLIMRPQKKRQQAVQQTLSSLTPGTRVLLGSGVFGTVVSVGTKQTVIETSPGVELTVLKQAIARVVTEADEDAPDTEDEDEPDDLEAAYGSGVVDGTPEPFAPTPVADAAPTDRSTPYEPGSPSGVDPQRPTAG